MAITGLHCRCTSFRTLSRYNTGSMLEKISPARAIRGVISVPGDKSVSHRYAMLASIAQGDSLIYNYSAGADCQSTLACMLALGIGHSFGTEDGGQFLVIHGQGMNALKAPAGPLDAGN